MARQVERGNLAVVGSASMFSDAYIGREDNSNLLTALLQHLMVRALAAGA
jgi:hypothetical protein